jgi:hypothetical protein
MEEYDVEVSDINNPEVTRKEIIKEINANIKKDMKLSRTHKGIQMDVKPEWSDLLLEDGSILRSYEKVGWKVRWYNTHSEGPARGKLLKSWLVFQSNDFAKQVR